jgi:hypothetical protein
MLDMSDAHEQRRKPPDHLSIAWLVVAIASLTLAQSFQDYGAAGVEPATSRV